VIESDVRSIVRS